MSNANADETTMTMSLEDLNDSYYFTITISSKENSKAIKPSLILAFNKEAIADLMSMEAKAEEETLAVLAMMKTESVDAVLYVNVSATNSKTSFPFTAEEDTTETRSKTSLTVTAMPKRMKLSQLTFNDAQNNAAQFNQADELAKTPNHPMKKNGKKTHLDFKDYYHQCYQS